MPGTCAATNLYVLMRAVGYEVGYADVMQAVPLGETSLLQLKEAAQKLGASGAVAEASDAAHLYSLEAPSIVHMDPPSGNIVSEQGYFLVVGAIREGADKVLAFEGSTGLFRTLRKGEFLQQWSGHVLTVPAPKPRSWRMSFALGVAMALLATVAQAMLVSRNKELAVDAATSD